MNLESSTWFG